MPDHDWNEHYASGQMPWDSNEPDPALVATVEAGTIPAGRALEVGCGTGTNALWLAAHGFDVLGVDVSALAIDRARAKMGDGAIACRFEVLDFLKHQPEGPFDFVFDRGCFHVFDAPEVRARFAALVAGVLAPGGLWLSLIGSTEGAPRDTDGGENEKVECTEDDRCRHAREQMGEAHPRCFDGQQCARRNASHHHEPST